MKKIIDYKVVTLHTGYENSTKSFNELVKKEIEKGFQPFGELKISIETGGSFLGYVSKFNFTQVMVKYEE